MTGETRKALSALLKSKDPRTRYEAVELICDLWDDQFDTELAEAVSKEGEPIIKDMIRAILGKRMKNRHE